MRLSDRDLYPSCELTWMGYLAEGSHLQSSEAYLPTPITQHAGQATKKILTQLAGQSMLSQYTLFSCYKLHN